MSKVIPKLGKRQRSQIVGIPKDQRLIIKMLIYPEKYGGGLFDYSCHGANWNVSVEVLARQSPIDIQLKELTEFEPQFKV